MTITALGAYKRVLKMQAGKIKIKEIRNYEAKNDINGNLHLKLGRNGLLFKKKVLEFSSCESFVTKL